MIYDHLYSTYIAVQQEITAMTNERNALRWKIYHASKNNLDIDDPSMFADRVKLCGLCRRIKSKFAEASGILSEIINIYPEAY